MARLRSTGLSYARFLLNFSVLRQTHRWANIPFLNDMFGRMKTTHIRAGLLRKVGENLYRYSSNRVYYAVFRSHGKLIWKSLETSDRELGKRRLKDELEKPRRMNGAAKGMTLEQLLTSCEKQLSHYDECTQGNKRSVVKLL